MHRSRSTSLEHAKRSGADGWGRQRGSLTTACIDLKAAAEARELQRRRTTPASAKQRRPHHGAGNDSDDADNDDDNYGNKLNSNSNHTAIAISLNDGTAGADPLPAKAGLAHHLVVRAVP